MLLDAMLRASSVTTRAIDYVSLFNAGFFEVKRLTFGGTGSEWNVGNGFAVLTVPASTTHTINGTITNSYLYSNPTNQVVQLMDTGLTSGSREVVIDDDVISAAEACNVTELRIHLPEANGTVRMNAALRTRLLEYLVRADTAVFSAAGTIKVYDGSAPASVESAATGTELLSFVTSTTSWDAASGNASSLASSIAATAGASGTVAYARFTWSSGGDTYVIQGSCGGGGSDFVVSSTSITSGLSYNLTSSTFSFA